MVRVMLAVCGRRVVCVMAATAWAQATGAALYGETCAACHGADAKGLNGPNLTSLWTSGATDDRVLQTIRNGVPGSIMPPSTAPEAELRAIIAHLKTLAAAPAATPALRAGSAAQTLASQPPVTLITTDGRQIHGERRNEDAFSIQIADPRGRLLSFLKTELRDILRGPLP